MQMSEALFALQFSISPVDVAARPLFENQLPAPVTLQAVLAFISLCRERPWQPDDVLTQRESTTILALGANWMAVREDIGRFNAVDKIVG